MKRSEMLRKLARHLSRREVDDIYEDAIDEMAFVQEAVLERLPNQPWFLQRETILGLQVGQEFVQLPSNYNGLMTRGGVWFQAAETFNNELLQGVSSQGDETESVLTPTAPCGPVAVNKPTLGASPLIGVADYSTGSAYPDRALSAVISTSSGTADGAEPTCPVF